jgi:hypothetical protein
MTDLVNKVRTSHYAQMVQDVHFLSHQLNLSGEYISSLTWRRRKELIEYHTMFLQESKNQK